MNILIFIFLIWCLMLILEFILHRLAPHPPFGFPQYFRGESMRVIPGEKDDEFQIEILQLFEAGIETWAYLKTIKGWPNVLLFVKEEEKRQRSALRPPKK